MPRCRSRICPCSAWQARANAQAAEYYESAIQSFDAEAARIDTAVTRIDEGNMLEDLLGAEQAGRPGWFWQLRRRRRAAITLSLCCAG
jgi:hypothetical protein